jgi:hypothetical protein
MKEKNKNKPEISRTKQNRPMYCSQMCALLLSTGGSPAPGRLMNNFIYLQSMIELARMKFLHEDRLRRQNQNKSKKNNTKERIVLVCTRRQLYWAARRPCRSARSTTLDKHGLIYE